LGRPHGAANVGRDHRGEARAVVDKRERFDLLL